MGDIIKTLREDKEVGIRLDLEAPFLSNSARVILNETSSNGEFRGCLGQWQINPYLKNGRNWLRKILGLGLLWGYSFQGAIEIGGRAYEKALEQKRNSKNYFESTLEVESLLDNF